MINPPGDQHVAESLTAIFLLTRCLLGQHSLLQMRATVRNSEVASAEREPKLFVSNLSFKTTDSDLEAMFAAHGVVVEAHHVNDKFDPERRRGFGEREAPVYR